eukprot:CAMPEP_0118918834 /NCGR_PEP_ID=MMETSP1166-20130328/18173_1 /TAXON_ID=1104430 /ORGANISM="Chrysoreinhardia sp, Strain CCMP3193" /LENGTH=168 /DNA_ID=CAMNT_0006859221 /DNA_START=134 /DNA_END=640 /DNA_ORIENTATION=-
MGSVERGDSTDGTSGDGGEVWKEVTRLMVRLATEVTTRLMVRLVMEVTNRLMVRLVMGGNPTDGASDVDEGENPTENVTTNISCRCHKDTSKIDSRLFIKGNKLSSDVPDITRAMNSNPYVAVVLLGDNGLGTFERQTETFRKELNGLPDRQHDDHFHAMEIPRRRGI